MANIALQQSAMRTTDSQGKVAASTPTPSDLPSDAGLATRVGTGVRRMIRLVRDALGKDITVELQRGEVIFTIPRKTSE